MSATDLYLKLYRYTYTTTNKNKNNNTIPSLATLSSATLCLYDMYPRKEKTTKPEKKLVKELMELVMIASLSQDRKKKLIENMKNIDQPVK